MTKPQSHISHPINLPYISVFCCRARRRYSVVYMRISRTSMGKTRTVRAMGGWISIRHDNLHKHWLQTTMPVSSIGTHESGYIYGYTDETSRVSSSFQSRLKHNFICTFRK